VIMVFGCPRGGGWALGGRTFFNGRRTWAFQAKKPLPRKGPVSRGNPVVFGPSGHSGRGDGLLGSGATGETTGGKKTTSLPSSGWVKPWAGGNLGAPPKTWATSNNFRLNSSVIGD